MSENNELGSLLAQGSRSVQPTNNNNNMIFIKLIIAIIVLFLSIYAAYRCNHNDPVHHCDLYKEKGCAHVDGPLCDYPHCTMLHDYHCQKLWNEGAQLGIKEGDRLSPDMERKVKKRNQTEIEERDIELCAIQAAEEINNGRRWNLIKSDYLVPMATKKDQEYNNRIIDAINKRIAPRSIISLDFRFYPGMNPIIP